MRSFLPFVGIILGPFFGYGVLHVLDGYYSGTVGKEHQEHLTHQTKCSQLRAEFFSECQKTMTRQQCEALFGQTRGHLFDGPPHIPFVEELSCDFAESPWDGR